MSLASRSDVAAIRKLLNPPRHCARCDADRTHAAYARVGAAAVDEMVDTRQRSGKGRRPSCDAGEHQHWGGREQAIVGLPEPVLFLG